MIADVAGLACTLCILGWFFQRRPPKRFPQRAGPTAAAPQTSRQNVRHVVATLAARVGGRLCAVLRWRTGAANQKAVGAAALTAAVVGPFSPVAALVAAGVAGAALTMRNRRTQALQRTAIESGVHDLALLLHMAAGAGVELTSGLALAQPWVRGPTADALAEVTRRHRAGSLLGDELERLGGQLGPPARSLTAVLTAAERFGSPLVGPLALVARDVQNAHRRQREAAARRLPVQLLAPLFSATLPAFVVLAVVPMLVSSFQLLRGHP